MSGFRCRSHYYWEGHPYSHSLTQINYLACCSSIIICPNTETADYTIHLSITGRILTGRTLLSNSQTFFRPNGRAVLEIPPGTLLQIITDYHRTKHCLASRRSSNYSVEFGLVRRICLIAPLFPVHTISTTGEISYLSLL